MPVSAATAFAGLLLAAGRTHTCAVIFGSVKCWGSIASGQLGYGPGISFISPAAAPYVTTGGNVTRIATGYGHTCVLFDVGGVKCWGSNVNGQLGYNHTVDVTNAASVDVVPLSHAASDICAGDYHTCVLLTPGCMKCWGHNNYGQLGTNNTLQALSPLDVDCIVFHDVVIPTAIACGGFHTCALLSSGNVTCWGYNNDGALGQNFPRGVLSPANVDVLPLNDTVIAISAGLQHTCALLSSGNLSCWGGNGNGQLGNGNTGDVRFANAAGIVPVGAVVKAVSAGLQYTCAVLEGGNVTCWGANSEGQLGYNHTNPVLSPFPLQLVPISSGVASIAVAQSHTCAISLLGVILCWGSNYNGQLGSGNYQAVLSAAAAPALQYFAPSPSLSTTASPSRSVSLTSTLSPSVTSTPASSLSATRSVSLTSTLSPSVTSTPAPSLSATVLGSATPTRTSAVSSTSSPSTSCEPSSTHTASVSSSYSFSITWSTTTSSSLSPSIAISSSSTGSASSLPSVTPSPSAFPTVPYGARRAALPHLQMMALSAITYKKEPAIITWASGGDTPSQQTLATLWRERTRTTTLAFSDGVLGQAVVSDASPPILVLVKANGTIQDYIGIGCRINDELMEFSEDTRVRVTSTPPISMSSPPVGELGERYHSFLVGGERSLLTAGNSTATVAGVLWCAALFPPSLSVPRTPVISMPVSLQPAVWAIPRGAIIQSTLHTRLLGVKPPDCVRTEPALSMEPHEAPWSPCTIAQLIQYAQAVGREQPTRPTWSPLTLDLNGATNITLILQATNIVSDVAIPPISVHIGDVVCKTTHELRLAGIVLVRCTTPTFALACVRSSNVAECLPQKLSVRTRYNVSYGTLDEWTGEAKAWLAENGANIFTMVLCNPFCDLLGSSTVVRTSLAMGDTSRPLSSSLSYTFDAGSMNASFPLAVHLSGPQLQLRPPVTYMDVCIGYADPGSGVCSNASSPERVMCAFGGGDDCRACPRGALCPGGYRAIPQAGFWAATSSSGVLLECPPPADRCVGWDLASDRVICSEGYDVSSPGCGWCSDGFYKQRANGRCSRCPSTDDPTTIIIPFVMLTGVVMSIVILFILVVCIVAKLVGGTTNGGMRRVVEFTSAVFQSIQLVSTVTSVAGNALPRMMQPVVNMLNALQVQGVLVDEACMDYDPYIRVYVLSGLAITLSTSLFLHEIVIQKWTGACRMVYIKMLSLFFSCYGIFAQTVMSAYQCAPMSMPLRSALVVLLHEGDSGQALLTKHGISTSVSVLSACDANPYMDGCIVLIPLLSRDIRLVVTRAYGRTDMCAGSAHVYVLLAATLALVLALLVVPLVLFAHWRTRRRAGQVHGLTTDLPDARMAAQSVWTRRHLDQQATAKALPASVTEASQSNTTSVFGGFLMAQRYVASAAYWWQLDCLQLLIVAAAIHAIGKPSTLLGIWCQTAVVCCTCVAAACGKAVTRPYKAENVHLLAVAIGIQVYSALIQLLMAVVYSVDIVGDDTAGFRAALTPLAVVCLVGAVCLLATIAAAFLYSLLGGAIMEQREQRAQASRRAQALRHYAGTVNPLLASSKYPSRLAGVPSDMEMSTPVLHIDATTTSLTAAAAGRHTKSNHRSHRFVVESTLVEPSVGPVWSSDLGSGLGSGLSSSSGLNSVRGITWSSGLSERRDLVAFNNSKVTLRRANSSSNTTGRVTRRGSTSKPLQDTASLNA